MTIAESISIRYRDDGSAFDLDGGNIEDDCREQCVEYRKERAWIDYIFGDGSSIRIAPYYWFMNT